jgi:hypothetical protein
MSLLFKKIATNRLPYFPKLNNTKLEKKKKKLHKKPISFRNNEIIDALKFENSKMKCVIFSAIDHASFWLLLFFVFL